MKSERATSCVNFSIQQYTNLYFPTSVFALIGFMTDLPLEFQHVKQNQIVDDGCLLFIPSKSVSKKQMFFRLT